MTRPVFSPDEWRRVQLLVEDLSSIALAQVSDNSALRVLALCNLLACEIEALPEGKRTIAANNVIGLIDYFRRGFSGSNQGPLVVLRAKTGAGG